MDLTQRLCDATLAALDRRFGPALVSVALFGSRARGGTRADSDAGILFDRGGFLKGVLDDFRGKLRRRGAERKRLGDGWYWILDRDAGPDCSVVIS